MRGGTEHGPGAGIPGDQGRGRQKESEEEKKIKGNK
jgi:hypothetical protein